jgi:hypothetical protein
MTEHDPEFAKDLLRGAEEIAQFLFGDRALRRKAYHLVASSNFPAFRLGSLVCARKSVVLEWVKDQEHRCLTSFRKRTSEQGGSTMEISNVPTSVPLKPERSQSYRSK